MKNILVFVNQNARQGQGCGEKIKAWLDENGFTVLNPDFNHKKDKISEVILKYRAQTPIVLVGGGDGSVNEALSGLMETQLPLLVIPLGTANNLARTLEIPKDYVKALELLNTGKITQIDVGLANDIPFVNVVGLGLSTQVNRLVRSEMKRWFGVLAFVFTAFKVALRMTPFKTMIEWDGGSHRAYSWQVTVCNGRNYGNGLVIHEDATLVDDTLHAVSTEVKKWWHAFAIIPSLLTGRFKPEQDVTIISGEKMVLKTARSMHVDVDGDIKTRTPLTLSVKSRALNIFVP
jgi:Sphingosine kinase and enzymes related to eukaryotic diacylglycerol kinase